MSEKTIWKPPIGIGVYQIFIECPDGTIETLNVMQNDYINYIKLQIQTITNNKYSLHEQKLFCKGKELTNNKTLKHCFVKRFDNLLLCANQIAIFIETQDGKLMQINAQPDESIHSIKERIQSRTGGEYLLKDQKLFNRLNKQELIDNNKRLFIDYGIIENSLLYVAGVMFTDTNKQNTMITHTNIAHKIDHILKVNRLYSQENKSLNKEMVIINIKQNKTKKLKQNKSKKHKRKSIKTKKNKSKKNKCKKNKSKKNKTEAQSTNIDYSELFGMNVDIMSHVSNINYNELFGDLIIRKRNHNKKRKHAQTVSMIEYDEIFGDSNDLMIGKITSSKFNKRNSEQIPHSMSSKHIKKKASIDILQSTTPSLLGMPGMPGMDIDSVFDMTEMDSIVNNLDIYEQNLNINNNRKKRRKQVERICEDSLFDSKSKPIATPSRRMSEILREIERDEITLHDDEKKTFENNRKQDFTDLMDGFFSDDDDDADDDDKIMDKIMDKPMDKPEMSLKKLMKKFTLPINNGLYEYYNKKLDIKYANELVNYHPTIITQPENFKSTKIRMLLTRMSKYVMNKVIIGQWKGNSGKEWKELSTNRLSYIFATKPMLQKALKSKYIKSNNIIHFENEKSNKIRLIGETIKYIDKIFKSNQKYNGINILFEDLPEIDNGYHQQNILVIGIEFYDSNNIKYDHIYISDRCAIYRNDIFLTMLSLRNCVMIENDSEIIIDIYNKQNNEIIIKFSHLRYGKLHKHNEREISFEKRNEKTYIKIYIHQFYGEATYSIYDMLQNVDNKNNHKANNHSHKKHLQSTNKSYQIDKNRKHRKSI